jgi:type II secretory pathway component PulF
MPKFAYKAKQGPHKVIEGCLEAESADRAIQKIMALGYTPLDVKVAQLRKDQASSPLSSIEGLWARRISLTQVAFYTRQLGDLIEAGIPVLRALDITGKQLKHDHFRKVIGEMARTVRDGGALSEAMSRHGRIFPPFYISMVKSGELGGKLNLSIQRLAEYLEHLQETQSQVRSSLVYPVFILIVAAAVVVCLLTFVVPKIATIYDDLSETLPLPTVMLIGFSDIFRKFWWLLAGGAGCAGLFLRNVLRTPSGKRRWDSGTLRVPVIGSLVRETEMGRFARTLGTLLDNGVVIVAALDAVGEVMDNQVIKDEVKRMAKDVKEGSSLTQAIRTSDIFPEAVVSMVAVGEEVGEPHRGLYKLAEFYERQTKRTMKSLTGLLEPVMILVLALIVFFVVIAMILPILRMNFLIQ